MHQAHNHLTNSEAGAILAFNLQNSASRGIAYSPRKRRFLLQAHGGRLLDSDSELWDLIERAEREDTSIERVAA